VLDPTTDCIPTSQSLRASDDPQRYTYYSFWTDYSTSSQTAWMQVSRVKPPSQKDLRRAFAAAIEECRAESSVSQEKLAEGADLSVAYVSLLERGRRNLTVYSAAKLAAALGMKTSQLVAKAESKLMK